MAADFNYYEGWTEQELLTERRMVQQQLSSGPLIESRLAGETTRFGHSNSASLELTLQRLAYALFLLCDAGQTDDRAYDNPYTPRITQQSHY